MTSYIRPEIQAMQGYVPGEQPREGSVIKLNTNENPYPSSPAVQRAIGMAIKMGLQKYPDPMADAFRQRPRNCWASSRIGFCAATAATKC